MQERCQPCPALAAAPCQPLLVIRPLRHAIDLRGIAGESVVQEEEHQWLSIHGVCMVRDSCWMFTTTLVWQYSTPTSCRLSYRLLKNERHWACSPMLAALALCYAGVGSPCDRTSHGGAGPVRWAGEVSPTPSIDMRGARRASSSGPAVSIGAGGERSRSCQAECSIRDEVRSRAEVLACHGSCLTAIALQCETQHAEERRPRQMTGAPRVNVDGFDVARQAYTYRTEELVSARPILGGNSRELLPGLEEEPQFGASRYYSN